MNQQAMDSFNKVLAVSLALGGVLLFVILLISLYLVPEPALARIDTVGLKTILSVFVFLLISAIGLMLYWVLHTPSPRRLTLSAWRIVVAYSFISCGFSVIGWPRLQYLSLDQDSRLEFEVTPLDISLGVAPNIAICLFGIWAMTKLYIDTCPKEEQYAKGV